MSASTAVAVPQAPTDSEIEGIRKAGAMQVEYRKELNQVSRQLEGMSWGSVQGSSFSASTRYALAEFCRITRANPLIHIDILGGKPYHNAKYWEDLCNSHPLFHHYEQKDLSPSVELALRERAKRHRELVPTLTGEEAARRAGKALDLEEEADDIAMARAQWSPPKDMLVVVQTTIYRFMNQAPMEEISTGKVTDFQQYLIAVAECNWAGGKDKDPVGNANPGLTARTRSFRRAATKAFSAWTSHYDQQIQKAEKAIWAEFEIIQDENAQRALPAGPQAVSTAHGEPSAARTEGARPLPVEGEVPQAPAVRAPERNRTPAPAPEFDRDDARKRLMATLSEVGIKNDPARKAWCSENDLPASTKDWSLDDFERAQRILMGPTIEAVRVALKGDEGALEDLSLRVLGKKAPEYLRNWKALLAVIQSQQDGEGEEERQL